MNIKIWVLVAVLLLALIIGYFVGKSMGSKSTELTVVAPAANDTATATAKPGINQAKTKAASQVV